MPSFEEVDICYLTNKGKVRERISRIPLTKTESKLSLYRQVLKAVRLIDLQFSNPLDLAFISRFSGVSLFHLSRIFKSSLGLNIYQYIKQRRLAYATHLLVNTPKSIMDISLDCGYESVTAFNAAFKVEHKVSPTQYRKSHVSGKKSKRRWRR